MSFFQLFQYCLGSGLGTNDDFSSEQQLLDPSDDVLQQQREEDAEEGWRKKTALFHTALDVAWLRHTALVMDGCLHIIVEGPDHAV